MLKIKKRFLTKLENETKQLAKKALYYRKNISKNSVIKYDDIIALRPRLNGICPSNVDKVLNKKTSKNITKNSIVKFKDFF